VPFAQILVDMNPSRVPLTTYGVMKKRRIRVLVVADSRVVRAGVALLIGRARGLKVAGVATLAEEAIALFRTTRPDVTVVICSLPKMRGLEVVRALHREERYARIVAIAPDRALRAFCKPLTSLTSAYLLEDASFRQLTNTIRKVVAEKQPRLAKSGVAPFVPKSQSPLTCREIQIIELVICSMRNKEIAYELGIAAETVHVHLRKIYSKLEVNDRAGMLAEAIRRGIVSISTANRHLAMAASGSDEPKDRR